MPSWRSLTTVQEAVDQHLRRGGGLLVVAGESGYAKEELAESVLRRCVDEGMLPLYGTMQLRDKERWAAVRELLGHLLRQLHQGQPGLQQGLQQGRPGLGQWQERQGQGQEAGRAEGPISDEELQELLSRERLTPAEAAAVVVLEARHNMSMSNLRRNSTFSMWPGKASSQRTWAIADCVKADEQGQARERAICELLRRLLERLLQQRRVLLILRCWRGTALSPGDPSVFWLLASRLGELAARQAPGQLLVLVLCRNLPEPQGFLGGQGGGLSLIREASSASGSCHGPQGQGQGQGGGPVLPPPQSPSGAVALASPSSGQQHQHQHMLAPGLGLGGPGGLGPHDRLIRLEPLDDGEAHVFAGLVLGVGLPSRGQGQGALTELAGGMGMAAVGMGAFAVPEPLRNFLRSIALNNPRNIQEALAELQESEKIRVVDGRVLLLADLSQVDIAEWVHTSMVGNIVSHFEMMGAEAQRVIKMATVLDGPFSALDLAAANRVHLPSSELLALHDSVQLLMACEWLVGQGFLTRYDCGTKDPADKQTPRLPRWEIANLLIRKVVGAALLQSQRILVKRSVLVARALNIQLPIRMRQKAQERETLFGQPSRAERSRQQRRRAQDPSGWAGEAVGFSGAGLPSSCIVLPLMEQTFDSTVQLGNSCESPLAAEDLRLRSFEHSGAVLPVPAPGFGQQSLRPVMGTVPESHLTQRASGDQSMPDVDRLADWLHLMCAAAHRHRALELIKRCAPVATRDAAGLSPLHFASGHGDLELVQALLGAAADASVAAPGVGTPLDLAAAHGHIEVVRCLVRAAPSRYTSLVRSKGQGYKLSSLENPLAMPPPMLGHDLPVRSRLEEANYRRSQTLTFLQDSIILAAEEVKEACTSVSLDGGRPRTSLRSDGSAPPHSVLGALAASRGMRFLSVVGTLVATLGPDICVIVGGSQTILDALLLTFMLFFIGQILLLTAIRPGYLCTAFFLLDIVGTAAMALDVSWLLGTSFQEPMTPDRPLDGRSGSYNLVLARLARGAALGNRAGRYSGITRLINLLCCCCLRPSEGGDFGSVEVFRQQVLRSIAAHVAGFTVLLVVVQPLLNFMTLPNSDLSMLAWLTILTDYRKANASADTWRREIGEFEQFYEQLALYGPYYLCAGSSSSGGSGSDFRCSSNGSLWGSDSAGGTGGATVPGWQFAPPQVEAARLRVSSDSLEALFDFSTAREREAWMNVALVFFVLTVMALTTLFITRSISDLVLRPLQRMLTSVKKIAQPILGDVSALGLDTSDEEDDGDFIDDEINTLERIVRKLGKIAGIATELSAASQYAASIENLGDEDRGVMQMMFQPRAKKVSTSTGAVADGAPPGVARARSHGGKTPQLDDVLRALHLVFEELCSWDFNVVQLGSDQARHAGVAHWLLLQNTVARGELQLSSEVALKFLQTMTQHYLAENPYHNFMHALDVMHTLWMMLRIGRSEDYLSALDQFSLLISAVSHDVGHKGVNNQFLVQTSHELAMRYNDRSPLENMHCAKTFGIASGTPGANVFETLSRSEFSESRRVCIEAILHTDMVHHNDMVKEAQVLYQINVEALETDPAGLFREKSTRQKVVNLFLHAADVSNPCKPWAICQEWAHRVLEEFFAQGDKEKQLGIPVQILNDRTKVNRPFSQIGFIEFMIVPLEVAKVKLFPMMYELTEFLQSNLQEWRSLWVDEDNPNDEEREKATNRVQRVCEALTQARESTSKHLWSKTESSAEDLHERLRRNNSTRGAHFDSSD